MVKEPHQALSQVLSQFYTRLLRELGPQGWWPARTRLEVVLGAILVQNTSWRNAALAITALRKAGLLSLAALLGTTRSELEAHIRPAGFYRQKARAIRAFLDWLNRSCEGSIAVMFQLEALTLRRELLSLRGFGYETVDAILLYAGRQPFFVADAYTRRILHRHGLIPEGANYRSAQEFLHRHLPPDHALFNEYHALLVEVGKRYCQREAPRCGDCPLEPFLASPMGSKSRGSKRWAPACAGVTPRGGSSQAGHSREGGNPGGGAARATIEVITQTLKLCSDTRCAEI